MIGALVMGFLFVQMWLRDERHGPLAALLGLCAVQALIISLAQHYEVVGMGLVQPITATLIPPMAWIAFRTTTRAGLRRADLLHLAGPLLAVVALVTVPIVLDGLIPLLFLGYGGLILRRARAGAATMPHFRLEAGELPGKIWQVIGVGLMASALSDGLIVAAQVADAGYLKPWIISFYTVGNLLLIGALSLSGNLNVQVPAVDDLEEVSAEEAEIMVRLEALMAQGKPFLDPDLTLARLARRLHVPIKQLSSAINRSSGENVSRYINGARVAAAQEALLAGESVTQAMLASGFQTKSNFNREFLRVAGVSPSQWARERRQG